MTLHCVWHQHDLHVFADAPNSNGASPTERLRSALGELAPDDALIAAVATQHRIRLCLPQRDGATVAQDGEGPATLAETEVETLALAPADAVDLLGALHFPLPDYCGDSFAWFKLLGDFAQQMVECRQFFPDLMTETMRSRWRLALEQPVTVNWLQQMATAIPPVCQSMADDVTPPLLILEQFLHESADALVRRALDDGSYIVPVETALKRESAPELKWLQGLMRADDQLHLDRAEREALTQHVRDWTVRLAESGYVSPARLRLRLAEPEADEDDEPGELWSMEIFLQPLDDDDAIPAEQLLNDQAETAQVLQSHISQRREQLVEELQRAGEVYSPLLQVIDSETPGELLLSSTDAYGFLRGIAEQLHAKGVMVELPGWASGEQSLPNLELMLHTPDDDDELFDSPTAVREGSGGGADATFKLQSLLDFDWRVAVGDLRLSVDEFRDLIAKNQPLMRFKGRWLQLDPEAARKALEFVEKKPDGKITFAEAVRTSLYASTQQTGLAIGGLRSSAWLDHLLQQAPPEKLAEMPQPTNFKGELRAYQLRGLQWLTFLTRLGLGACLADDMGLGKTIQLISLLQLERQSNPDIGPTIVFAPTSVVGNWMRELSRFAPDLKAFMHHGPDRPSGKAFVDNVAKIDVLVSSYALAYRDAEDLATVHWHRLVLDEAQKIKNPSAAATIAIRSIPATHRVAMTGTPIENRLSELWSIMEVLNPGLLGDAAEFRERLAVPIERLHDTERAAQLRRLVRPFVLRRTKDDPQIAGDLPPKMEMKVFCNLTAEQATHYQRITEQMLGSIDSATGIRRRGLILAALTRLKQICNHPAQFLKQTGPLDQRSGKAERMVEMLEEVLEEQDAALVFTQFREMATLLQQLLESRLHRKVLLLHGGTPTKNREKLVEDFNKEPQKNPIMVLSLRAGGLGLNLTAASHVFHFDRWWNPAVENQATDRAHRIGQTRVVQVHKLICIGTMEERIDRMLSEKLALAGTIIGAGDDWLTGLSTEQLRQYISLAPDAVGDDD